MALKSTDIMSRFPELSAEKQKLLAELLEREVLTQTAKTTIPRRGSQSASLSYAQQRLWFLHEFEEEKSLYNVPLVVRIRGELQADILERAIKEIVRRHEVLRTGFAMVDGSPVQVIAPEATVNLERIDLRGLETEDRRAAKNRIIDERARGVFDLGSGPLLRVTLAQVEDREYFLVVVLHHIVSDGWSMSVFTRELTALYEGCREGRESPLAEPAIQYADYAMWQRQWLLEEPQREKMEYWRKQLQGVPELLELSVAKARPPVPSHAGAEWRFEWGPELAGGLL